MLPEYSQESAAPGVVSELVCERNRVKDPTALTGSDIERPDIPLGVGPAFGGAARSMGRAHDDQVPGHDGCGVQGKFSRDRVEGLIHSLFQIDHAGIAEPFERKSGLGIQAHQLVPDRHHEYPFVVPVVPVRDAASRQLPCGGSGPLTLVEAVHP